MNMPDLTDEQLDEILSRTVCDGEDIDFYLTPHCEVILDGERLEDCERSLKHEVVRTILRGRPCIDLQLSRLPALIAAELAAIDGYDAEDQHGGLYDLRWTGGGAAPEPLGDAWNMDYLPKGERIAALLASALKTGK